ncbi:MAG: LacI family DNA-binding transcriptional regulator [Verrucomicrobia bacterium]|nr:LacI family DNA-binding transcriptional regulator [Verrucomicrobiota bacterium]MCH8525912.1 LacI family DNA-binding transcriptional regulator [Kiritimatiellia bacterium]
MPISLKHIAQAAGVSRTTVSLALRNHPRISLATRKKIQKLAKDMGYVPNAEVSKVMEFIRENKAHHDRPVLGLITDYPEPMSGRNEPSQTWVGFRDRAEALGYRPEEFWMGDHAITPRRLHDILYARGIRGFVFSALKDPGLVREMDLSDFACACIGHSISTPALHRASSDKYANTLKSCEKLWETGCRRIGLAVPLGQETRVEHIFLSAYLVFHHLHQHAGWRTPLVEEGEWDPDRIAAWAEETKVDGLIVAYKGLEDLLPNIPLARVNIIDGTGPGMIQRHDLIASAAVDLVDAQLRRNETGIPVQPKTLLIHGEWIAD